MIIAGGGTGGHLFPAIAVGEELARQRPATDILFVGSSAGFEAQWLPKQRTINISFSRCMDCAATDLAIA